MSGEIFVVRDDGSLEGLREQAYDSEDLLQALLARYPSILAGDQISPSAPRKWLLVKREAPVPDAEGGPGRWSLDHLFIDQDGVPTLVEVKRSTDTRIRREVVGQMLDYAANAVAYWSIESIVAAFEQTCMGGDVAPEVVLVDFLGSEVDPESFWQNVKTNLQAGRVRMLFVADRIPDELRRIVEFLNSQMDPAEVLAVEIKQFTGDSLKTLVPRVIGQTAEAERRRGRSSRPTRQWDEASFFVELENVGGAELCAVARRILDWAVPRATRIAWGTGGTAASLIPILRHADANHHLFNMHTGFGSSPPSIELQFQHHANKPPFDDRERRTELLRRFNEIEGVNLTDDAIDGRPKIPLATFTDADVLEPFFAAMQWFVDEVRRS